VFFNPLNLFACDTIGCEAWVPKDCNPERYGYGRCNGPATWAEKFPQDCATLPQQSPINIVLFGTKPVTTSGGELNQFTGHDLSTPLEGKLYNTGTTLKFIPDDSNVVSLLNKATNKNYKLAELTFHWGSTNKRGSEHWLYGKAYPLEMHMLVQEQDEGGDGQILYAVIFNIAQESSALDLFDDELNIITKAPAKDQSNKIPASIVLDFVKPIINAKCIVYRGSLTTPPCTQMDWVVGTETAPVTKKQLASFRALKDEFGNPLVDNYRPLRPDDLRDMYGVNFV